MTKIFRYYIWIGKNLRLPYGKLVVFNGFADPVFIFKDITQKCKRFTLGGPVNQS